MSFRCLILVKSIRMSFRLRVCFVLVLFSGGMQPLSRDLCFCTVSILKYELLDAF